MKQSLEKRHSALRDAEKKAEELISLMLDHVKKTQRIKSTSIRRTLFFFVHVRTPYVLENSSLQSIRQQRKD
ncbi:hypothetical protein JNUCC42_21585 [Brevibacterium sp. JNUCC-42]|nr:hypothetical protein JNUCC42_21585 [Brevibacterium sp. JNUCC-42]